MMQINWDMSRYGRMAEDARHRADAARMWICSNERLAAQYVAKVDVRHPAVWFGIVMTLVKSAIDAKEQDAVDLGCRYIIQQERAPFGKIHKGNILVRLKRNRELIKEEYIPDLIKTYEAFLKMKYKPRETRELAKLMKCIR